MLHHSASDGTHLALCRLSVLAVLSESSTFARPSSDGDFKLKHLACSYKFTRRVCTVPVGSTGLKSQRRPKVLPNVCLPWDLNCVCSERAMCFGSERVLPIRRLGGQLAAGLWRLGPGFTAYLYWLPIQMGSPACKMCSTGYSLAPHCWMGSIIRKRLLAVED